MEKIFLKQANQIYAYDIIDSIYASGFFWNEGEVPIFDLSSKIEIENFNIFIFHSQFNSFPISSKSKIYSLDYVIKNNFLCKIVDYMMIKKARQTGEIEYGIFLVNKIYFSKFINLSDNNSFIAISKDKSIFDKFQNYIIDFSNSFTININTLINERCEKDDVIVNCIKGSNGISFNFFGKRDVLNEIISSLKGR